MPVITIESSQLTVEKKREAAAVITTEFSRISGIPEQAITVLFHELPRESIATAGRLLSDRDRSHRPRMDGRHVVHKVREPQRQDIRIHVHVQTRAGEEEPRLGQAVSGRGRSGDGGDT